MTYQFEGSPQYQCQKGAIDDSLKLNNIEQNTAKLTLEGRTAATIDLSADRTYASGAFIYVGRPDISGDR